MLSVLHCTFLRKGENIHLALWTEGRNGLSDDPRLLNRILRTLSLNTLSGDSDAFTWLKMAFPGKKGIAQTSTPLLEGEKRPGRIGLIQTRVRALTLPPAQALKFFQALTRLDATPENMLTGPDCRYWLHVIQWLVGFLIRQGLIPSLQPVNGGWQAVFQPFFRPESRDYFSHLTKAMPHCCLAACALEEGWEKRVEAGLLYDVTEAVGDAMAKAALAHSPSRDWLYAHREENIHDAWLYALASGKKLSPAGSKDPCGGKRISDLPLSKVTQDALTQNGIECLADLLSHGEFDLLTLPGFGGKCLLEVLKLLDGLGLKLKSPGDHTRRPPLDFKTFSRELLTWHRPLQDQLWTDFRLCFRLIEPESQNGDWNLTFLLQDLHDPSLLVPASHVWESGKDELIQKRFKNSREKFISALGRAARLFPPIKKGMKISRPSGCLLTLEEAYSFLTEGAWILEDDGFGVFLPAWWTGKGRQPALQARARVSSPGTTSGGVSLNAPLDFDWEVALGDETLTKEELEQLALLKAPLLKIRGQWVELQQSEIQAALSLWDHRTKEVTLTLKEVLKVGLGGEIEKEGLRFTSVSTGGWIQDLIAGLKVGEALGPLKPPKGFVGRLRPYQKRGYSWLHFLTKWGLGACLADDMGLGKTVQALALVQKKVEEGLAGPFLLVCPTSVLGNWSREAANFVPKLKVYIHHGPERKKRKELEKAAAEHHIVLTSFALVHRDLKDLKKISWAGIIVDEAQNIKNHRTMQAQAIRSLSAPIRVAMTGTPVENSVSDLWSIMEFLNPGLLGNRTSFKRNFLVPVQVRGDQEAFKHLRRISGPFVLRRLKTDRRIIADLPDKMEMDVFVPLTREQASLYQALVNEAENLLKQAHGGIQRKGLVLATLTKLKQVCNHPALFLRDGSALPGRSGKLTRLEEMIEVILSEGDAALIFTQFAQMGKLLTSHLSAAFGQEVLFIHGQIPRAKRDKIVRDFQRPDGPSLMVLSLRAAGTGLNLTRASHVFHFDRWWNPAVEDQATDRTFRIGQRKNVQVHKFVCQGTVEERINQLINTKRDLADKIVGAGEAWIAELSTSDIKKLLRLDQTQVQ